MIRKTFTGVFRCSLAGFVLCMISTFSLDVYKAETFPGNRMCIGESSFFLISGRKQKHTGLPTSPIKICKTTSTDPMCGAGSLILWISKLFQKQNVEGRLILPAEVEKNK